MIPSNGLTCCLGHECAHIGNTVPSGGIFSGVGTGWFRQIHRLHLVPLILEYQAAAQRILPSTRFGRQDIDGLIDFFCTAGERHQIHYLWRPQLQDPKDDMILELAMAARANAIVTFNKNHFKEVLHFGIEVISPQDLLTRIGAGR